MEFRVERWPSGRRQPPAKRLYGQKPYPGFESLPLRHAPLAQLDRASDYESEGRGFDSLRAHHYSGGFTGGRGRVPSRERREGDP